MNAIKKLLRYKFCPKCKSDMRPISFFPIKGWRCLGCSGVYGKVKYILHNKILIRSLSREVHHSKHVDHKCVVCENPMVTLQLKSPKLNLEYCAQDLGLFFDEGEEAELAVALAKKAPYKGHQNPGGVEHAIRAYYGEGTHGAANGIIALNKIKDDPAELEKFFGKIDGED